jgi:hypothetical protein
MRFELGVPGGEKPTIRISLTVATCQRADCRDEVSITTRFAVAGAKSRLAGFAAIWQPSNQPRKATTLSECHDLGEMDVELKTNEEN